MAKAQKRSTREIRKPKATKVKPALPALAASPIGALSSKPKAKS